MLSGLATLYYQIQQETIYYTVEMGPIRRLVHALNIANLYRELSDLHTVIAAETGNKGNHPLPPPPPPTAPTA